MSRSEAAAAVVLTVDGRKVALVEHGDPAGRPVFLFHGTPASRLGSSTSTGYVPAPRGGDHVTICIDRVLAADYGFPPDAPGLHIDVGTATATLLLAAHALGIGSGPVTSFSRAAITVVLRLPPGWVPELVVCLGHPAPVGQDHAPGTAPHLARPHHLGATRERRPGSRHLSWVAKVPPTQGVSGANRSTKLPSGSRTAVPCSGGRSRALLSDSFRTAAAHVA
jgi:hypothetical protein